MSHVVENKIPLTVSQKLHLAGSFVPVVFFVVMSIFLMILLPIILGQSVSALLAIFLVIILLVMISDTSKSLRDLRSGEALIEEDQLDSIRLAHSRSSTCFGTFTRLGELRIIPSIFEQAQAGQIYRVCYSPASHIVWSLEAN